MRAKPRLSGRILLAASLVLTAAGCGLLTTEQAAEQATDRSEPQIVSLSAAEVDTFAVGYGATIEVRETGLRLRFEDVADSRCAADVTCIWAGEAELTFVAVRAGQEQRIALKMPGLVEVPYERNEPVTVHGHRIRLLRVDPYPYASSPWPASRYRALVAIEPAG